MTVSGIGLGYALIVAELLTLEEGQALVLAPTYVLESEPVLLADSAGRVAASSIRAAVDLPPFASSAMDGYAIRAADIRASELPCRLPIVARIAAGRPAERALAVGEAMEISTGGVVPDGADAVVPVEYVVK